MFASMRDFSCQREGVCVGVELSCSNNETRIDEIVEETETDCNGFVDHNVH